MILQASTAFCCFVRSSDGMLSAFYLCLPVYDSSLHNNRDGVRILADINDSYTKFKAQLAPQSEEQLITPEVNGTWSIKDNIAHLSAWQKVLLARLLAARDLTPYAVKPVQDGFMGSSCI